VNFECSESCAKGCRKLCFELEGGMKRGSDNDNDIGDILNAALKAVSFAQDPHLLILALRLQPENNTQNSHSSKNLIHAFRGDT